MFLYLNKLGCLSLSFLSQSNFLQESLDSTQFEPHMPGRLQSLPSSIRQGCKWLTVANTLVYYVMELILTVKSFMVQALVVLLYFFVKIVILYFFHITNGILLSICLSIKPLIVLICLYLCLSGFCNIYKWVTIWTQDRSIGHHHPLDGITNSKYKLLHF